MATASPTKEGEDVKQPMARASASYGSTLEDDRPVLAKDSFLDKIDASGAPHVLLLNAWAGLLPILGPLYLITLENINMGEWCLRCARWPVFTAMRTSCDITYVGLAIFPCVTRVAAVALVTWTLARQRLFYALLGRRIVVDLEDAHGVSKSILGLILALCALAFGHLLMYFLFALHTPEEELKKPYDQRKVSTEYELKVPVSELIANPTLLLDPSNRNLLDWMMYVARCYIGPAVLALIFAFASSDAESTIIPFIKMYKNNPYYVHSHLRESFSLREEVARRVVSQGRDAPDNDVQSSKKPCDQEDLSEVCELFKREAIASGEAPSLESGRVDVETALVSAHEVEPPCPIHIQDLMLQKTWWFVGIITDMDSEGRGPIQFRTVWMLHCFVSALIFALEAAVRFYTLGVNWVGLMTGHPILQGTTIILHTIPSIVLGVGCSWGCWMLVRHLVQLRSTEPEVAG